MFPWLAPFVASTLTAILKHFIEKLFTEEVTERVLVDIADHVAKKTTNDLDDHFVATAKKALKYKGK